MKSEEIIIQVVSEEFDVDESISDDFIFNYPCILGEINRHEILKYLPVYMIYALKELRSNPDSMVYMQLLSFFNEHSKYKGEEKGSIDGIWQYLSLSQKNCILLFLKHIGNNKPVNLDREMIDKIIKRFLLLK